MDFNISSISQSLYCHLICVGVGVLASTAVVCLQWNVSWTCLDLFVFYGGIFLLCAGVFLIIRTNRANVGKIDLMLEAVRNNDFSFRFPQENQSKYDRLLNLSLNKMNGLLLDAKRQTIEREKYYDLILESVTTGVVVLDSGGFVLRCNPSALNLLGLSSFTVVHQLQLVNDELREVYASIRPEEKRHLSFQNSQGEVHLIFRCSQIVLQGKPVRIIAFNDIKSEIDDNEVESWVRLTRVLTHEIMNSIAPINSLSDTMLALVHSEDDSKENRAKISQGLDAIRTTSNGLMAFVDSYRKFSLLQNSVPQLVYVRDLLHDVQQLQQSVASISWKVSVTPDDLIIYVDGNLVRQVLINIVKNAIEAGAHSISIRSFCMQNETVVIEVSNDGEVIPEKEAAQVFVPFFTTKKQGTGIGLSVSRQIMKMNGGSISLRQIPEEGFSTTFVLQFN